MGKESESLESGQSVEKTVTRLMLKTLFSTTLRIFAPVTILFAVGLIIDLNAATKPWGMITGTALGIILALALVARQLIDIRKNPWQANLKKEVKNGR